MTEPYRYWTPPTGCDPRERRGVQAFRAFIIEHFGGENLGIIRACEPGNASSLHHEGRAWDWGTVHRPARVADMLEWLLMDGPDGEPHYHLRQLGIVVVIWNRRIWSTRTKTWRAYTGASPHTDHVHFGFAPEGADGETDGYRPTADGVAVDLPPPREGQGIPVGPSSPPSCSEEPPSTQPAGGEIYDNLDTDPSMPEAPAATLAAVRGLEEQSRQFRSLLWFKAHAAGLDPDALAAVISFETAGTFNPKIRNRWSAAVGLIQWTPIGAKALGRTMDEIAAMSQLEQLDLAIEWFELAQRVAPLVTVADYYMAVFAPAFIGAPSSATMYERPTKAYRYNEGLDTDGDGRITKDEAAAPVRRILADAEKRPRLDATQA